MKSHCPCCESTGTEALIKPDPHEHCLYCGHRWRGAVAAALNRYYSGLQGRNAMPKSGHERKIRDRLASLRPLLKNGVHVLEIGCAEGDLAVVVKGEFRLHYTGVELSGDARTAAKVLDRIVTEPSISLGDEQYDLIVSFHVLEHIPDVAEEVAQWHHLLDESGTLLVEVPKEAGHPLLVWDKNPEHIHQFTVSSLTALLARSGFNVTSVTSGHFESSVYPDSLRVLARPCRSHAVRRLQLLARFNARLTEPFAVYGIGGDFHNYIEPLIDTLPISALLDSNPSRYGERICNLEIEAFSPLRHKNMPILVSSIRYKEEIIEALIRSGAPPVRLVGLDEVYEGCV